MKHAPALISALLGLMLAASAALAAPPAQKDAVGEGYAAPSFRELVQTFVLLDAVDISHPGTADEYARIVYPGTYAENYNNDIAWDKIRAQIVSRVQDKKEPFRIFYEKTSAFKLGRYDVATQSFPLSPDTAMKDVASISLIDNDRDDNTLKESPLFPPRVSLELFRALTVDSIPVPLDQAGKTLARIEEESGGEQRQVYGRIRLRVTGAQKIPPLTEKGVGAASATLQGEVMSIDFFIDKDMTKFLGKVREK